MAGDPRNRQSRGLTEALQLRGLPARRPTEADAPAPKPPPGPKIGAIKGQLDVFGNEVGATPEDERRDDAA